MSTMTKDLLNTRNMVKIAILGAIGMVLMFFELTVGFAPPFLKLDISDMPALIGSFAMGPGAGVVIQFIKNILSLLIEGTSTGGVGELSNFIVGSAFVFTAGYIYSKNRVYKNAIIGLITGVIVMTLFATFSNYFIVFPLYARIMIPLDEIVAMASSVNNLVVDYKTLILYAVVPFNLLKGAVVSAATLLIYKRVSPILQR